MTALWYLVIPTGPWHYLNDKIAGVVLQNLLVLSSSLPFPAVLLLLLLTAVKARQRMSSISDDTENVVASDASRQMERDLRLIYAFGIVYIVGFGFLFVCNINSLINLGGAVHVLPYWQKDAENNIFCGYALTIEFICNILINLSNSVIVVQSRHVQIALKKMYRVTSRVVRNVSGGDVTEDLIQDEEPT